MTDFIITIIIVTHHPNWANIQALLNSLLTVTIRWLVINKANDEAQCLHQENYNGTLNKAGAILLTEPDWDTNGGGLDLLEHHKRCILEWLKKGVPKPKSLNMIQTLQQKQNKVPSEFLERIYQAYRKHINSDLEVPQNVWIVNLTFIGQCPEYQKDTPTFRQSIGNKSLPAGEHSL